MRLYSVSLKVAWTVILLAATCIQFLPIASRSPMAYYPEELIKFVLFLAAGFAAPLAFLRFNAMNGGVVAAGAAAILIEMLAGFSKMGHHVHFGELAFELLLIVAGYGMGIVSRYDRFVGLGRVRVRLTEVLS